MKKILDSFEKNGFRLKNHIVMAPMTRSRAIGNTPNDLMATYYEQRAGAGLIITEGTSPSPGGLGYARIPGIYSQEQMAGWKKVTDRVHQRGTAIFVQMMHTGRIGHVDNIPGKLQPVGPSSQKAGGEIFTDTGYLQEHSEPVALSAEGIRQVKKEFVQAALNAVEAGFDGVELHAANGYLLEQFLHPFVNNRTDAYGGSIENRSRFILEMVTEMVTEIGKEKLGIRFSPYSVLGDLEAYDPEEVHQTYAYLAAELNKAGIAYIHISANPSIPKKTYKAIREVFENTIILCNGLAPENADAVLNEGFADLVGFGRYFIANPDLVGRIEKNAPLSDPDSNTFFTAGEKGYIDYPVWA